jgi:hypothetical protein
MLTAIEISSMGKNEVLMRLDSINIGTAEQNRIISQYNGA